MNKEIIKNLMKGYKSKRSNGLILGAVVSGAAAVYFIAAENGLIGEPKITELTEKVSDTVVDDIIDKSDDIVEAFKASAEDAGVGVTEF